MRMMVLCFVLLRSFSAFSVQLPEYAVLESKLKAADEIPGVDVNVDVKATYKDFAIEKKISERRCERNEKLIARAGENVEAEWILNVLQKMQGDLWSDLSEHFEHYTGESLDSANIFNAVMVTAHDDAIFAALFDLDSSVDEKSQCRKEWNHYLKGESMNRIFLFNLAAGCVIQ